MTIDERLNTAENNMIAGLNLYAEEELQDILKDVVNGKETVTFEQNCRFLTLMYQVQDNLR